MHARSGRGVVCSTLGHVMWDAGVGFPLTHVAMSTEGDGEPPAKKLRTGGGDGLGEVGGEIKDGPGSSLTVAKEGDVGITEFVSDHDGFFAVLKRR